MFATCGKPKLSEQCLNHLRKLGQGIHAGQQPFVFDQGFVSLVEQRESEVNSDATKTRARNRSTSRQGQRRGKSWRPRPASTTKPLSSRATEEAHGAGFRLLARHYDALGFDAKDGLLVAVCAKPLGASGPQAHFLIAAPNDLRHRTAGWAFSSIGPQAKLFPLKHTNFPDASICAFTKESGAWSESDGLLPLADHFALWAVKSWHLAIFGWWPGPQVGACAYYRLREFAAIENCGCGSGKQYADCHMALDRLRPDDVARTEFQKLFSVDYHDRAPPYQIMEAARSRWKVMPPFPMLSKSAPPSGNLMFT